MAELKKDANFVSVSGGVTDDASQTVEPLLVNPATGRLEVDASISSVTISGGTITTVSGGTVNIGSMPSLSVSTGTPVSLDWVGGVAQSGGSVSVNVLSMKAGGTVGIRYDASGSISVNVLNTVVASGSVGINYASGGSISVNIIGATGTINVGSPVAHDGADGGNPIKIGAKASTGLSGVTTVSNNDRTDLYSGADGVLFVRTHTGLEDIVTGSGGTSSNGTVALLSAGGSNVKVYLTDITICNSYGTMLTVDIYDNQTAKYTFPAPATGGATHSFTVPLPQSTANTGWFFRPSIITAGSGSVFVSAIGFKSKI